MCVRLISGPASFGPAAAFHVGPHGPKGGGSRADILHPIARTARQVKTDCAKAL